jgi:TRAP-type mannitol/chloroaromatic compound transport system permease large subunit
MNGALDPMASLARNHPVAFVLTSVVAWLVLLVVLLGVVSSALRTPYGDATIGAIGRLAVTACVLRLLWHLGWLKAAGVTRLGMWQVWLLALGGMVCFAGAGLYSFYGPPLRRKPDWTTAELGALPLRWNGAGYRPT